MIYLAKLAHRMSLLKSLVPAVLLASACSEGKPADFLSPNPALIEVVSIRVSPQVATVKANEAFQFSAIAVNSEGDEFPATVDWVAPSGGTITASGQFTATRSGQYRVRAHLRSNPGLRDSATAGVWELSSDVLYVTVNPDSALVYEGEAIDFDAVTRLADGTIQTTDAVTWSATGGTIDAGGVFTASTSADYTVTAVSGNGVTGKGKVKVRRRQSLSITPSFVSLSPGGAQQFAVSSSAGGSPAVTWAATGGTVSASGLYTAGTAAGTFRVVGTETGGTAADTSTVTIAAPAPTLTAVTISPSSLSIQTGGARQFTATGTWSDGSTGSIAVNWTATGGSITSSGLYTAGGTAGTFRVIGTQVGGTRADTTTVTITAAPVLTAVVVSPSSASLSTGGAVQFSAIGAFSDGSSSAVPVTWSATGGTISGTGLYTAGSSAGTFRVIAAAQGSTLADTALVTIQAPPPPGQYATIARQDWNVYADKSALAGMIGVEGGLNTQPPALPATAFYDLVPDPIFGKVLRYNGGPSLNTTDPNMPGRVATHQVALGKCSGAPSSWWLAPNGCRYPGHVWVRQFIRFTPNWTPASLIGGQGAADYKTMFLRYYNSSARHEFKVTNIREWIMDGGSAGINRVSQGTLSWNNVQSIDAQYGTQGFHGVDLLAMVKPTAPDGNCYPSVLPCPSQGDGQWYEIIMHHKTVGNRGEFTQYIRRYTANGVVSPAPWRINAHYTLGGSGEVFWGLSHYQMGINRNRQYDQVMYHHWGPYEVVDGAQYPNPWGLPGG